EKAMEGFFHSQLGPVPCAAIEHSSRACVAAGRRRLEKIWPPPHSLPRRFFTRLPSLGRWTLNPPPCGGPAA
ncbi:MAG: hypothetical protein WCJ18_10325, partial [Planctomycetota bacterium]